MGQGVFATTRLKKDYSAIFRAILAHQNPRKFASEFKKGFRPITNFKWAGWIAFDCENVTDARGSPIPIWEIIDTLDNPAQTRFKGALFFLLDVDWYKGIPKGEMEHRGREGPACWGEIYGRILRALEKTEGVDRVWHVNRFLKKLRFILTRGDTTVYHAPIGLRSAITSSLRILSSQEYRDSTEADTNTRLPPQTSYDSYTALVDAYVAIRRYYHSVLVKRNLDGNEILVGLLDIMKRIAPPMTIRGTLADFLVSQIPAAHLSGSSLRRITSKMGPPYHQFDDFTCEQLAKLGRPALEAIARASIKDFDPIIVAAAKYMRKFLDAPSLEQLDILIQEEKVEREHYKAEQKEEREKREKIE